RVRSSLPDEDPAVEVGPLYIGPGAKPVTLAGKALAVTRTERRVLLALARNAGRVLTIRQIAHAAWGLWAKRATEHVRVYLSLLRRKLEPDPARPRWLVTRWGAGYCLLSSPAGE